MAMHSYGASRNASSGANPIAGVAVRSTVDRARALTPAIAVVLAIAVAAVALRMPLPAQKAPERREPGPDARGAVYEWTSPQGQPFWYRVPDRVDAKDPPNLLVMLHGTGVPQGWAFWNYPIADGSWRGSDIVLAPEGVTPGHGDTFNFIQGPKDGEQIADLIKLFRKRFPISRVYLYGHSQGAFFCYWFAGAHPELIDGIVAHAGNVLAVEHPKLAKDKVAIGILHGRADAVVPVDCAFRTERIYREQGYRLVRCTIVEGLTEQSGHWPLPVQVGEMLAWLDQVTAVSPAQALRSAVAEIGKPQPDVEVVAEALRRAKELLKKDKDAGDDAALVADLEFVELLVSECAAAHAAELSRPPVLAALTASKLEYHDGVVHFRIANAAFAGRDEWDDAMKSVARKAKPHDAAIEKALKALGDPSAKSLRDATGVLEKAVLGAGYTALLRRLEGMLEAPPSGARSKDLAELRELLGARKSADDGGAAAVARVDAEVLKSLRERFPERFPAK